MGLRGFVVFPGFGKRWAIDVDKETWLLTLDARLI